MSGSSPEPPSEISYGPSEALVLLADLEDTRDALIDAGLLAAVVKVEVQIRTLARKLEFDV